MIPESVLSSGWFAVLAAFVAINTAMYVVLALTDAPRPAASTRVRMRVTGGRDRTDRAGAA